MKVKISKIPMKFDPRVTWENLILTREHLFVYAKEHSGRTSSMKIQSKTDKKLFQIRNLFT